MSFGSSCEPRKETAYEARRRKREESRKTIAERTDCFDRIVALCAVRDRSSTELVERLGKDGYTSAQVEEALGRSRECGLVDDARFADAFVRGRVSAGKGARGIEKSLLEHGIDPLSLEGWPEAYGMSEEEQVERGCDYLRSHPPRAKDAWAAAYRKLLSRGYSARIASKACRLWADEALS